MGESDTKHVPCQIVKNVMKCYRYERWGYFPQSIRVDLFDMMALEHKPEGTELWIYGKSILDGEKSKYKALGQECSWQGYATAVTAGQLKDYRVFNQSNKV